MTRIFPIKCLNIILQSSTLTKFANVSRQFLIFATIIYLSALLLLVMNSSFLPYLKSSPFIIVGLNHQFCKLKKIFDFHLSWSWIIDCCSLSRLQTYTIVKVSQPTILLIVNFSHLFNYLFDSEIETEN